MLLLLLCLLCTSTDTAMKDQEFRAASSVSTSSPDWYPSAQHRHHAVRLQTDCMVLVPAPWLRLLVSCVCMLFFDNISNAWFVATL